MRIKKIKYFDDYFISEDGDVYSCKSGKMKKISSWIDSKGNYLLVSIIDNNNKRHNKLVHRLVADAFIPNPNNLPEVDHIDNDTKNPKSENLQWTTRKENLKKSYKTKSPVRNFKSCLLYRNDVLIGEFKSVSEASRFGKDKFNLSLSSLSKYLECKEFKIVRIGIDSKDWCERKNGKYIEKPTRTKQCLLYENNEIIGKFDSITKATEVANSITPIHRGTLASHYRYKQFKIKICDSQ